MPTVSQIRYAYIKNDPNTYRVKKDATSGRACATGWHYIPANRLHYYFTPAKWQEIQRTCQTLTVKSITVKVSNMIPITTNVAINQNTTFSAFNNTIYALAYDDKDYVTRPTLPEPLEGKSWLNLWQREGVFTGDDGTLSSTFQLPQYIHYNAEFSNVDGQAIDSALTHWDPLSDAMNIMELRPGKNAVEFHWQNERAGPTMRLAGATFHGGPFTKTVSHPQPNDVDEVSWQNYNVSIADSFKMPISERGGMAQKQIRSNWNSLNQEQQNWRSSPSFRPKCDPMNFLETFNIRDDVIDPKPLPNWFIKMIPLFDKDHNVIRAEANILIQWICEYETTPLPQKEAFIYPNYCQPLNIASQLQGPAFGRFGNILAQPTWIEKPRTMVAADSAIFTFKNNVGFTKQTFTTQQPTATTTTITNSAPKRPQTRYYPQNLQEATTPPEEELPEYNPNLLKPK